MEGSIQCRQGMFPDNGPDWKPIMIKNLKAEKLHYSYRGTIIRKLVVTDEVIIILKEHIRGEST